MGASVLEAVTRVGVALAAAFIGADVGLFPCVRASVYLQVLQT